MSYGLLTFIFKSQNDAEPDDVTYFQGGNILMMETPPSFPGFRLLYLIIGGGDIFSPQVVRKKKQLPFPSQARPSAAILDAPTESGQRGGAGTNPILPD